MLLIRSHNQEEGQRCYLHLQSNLPTKGIKDTKKILIMLRKAGLMEHIILYCPMTKGVVQNLPEAKVVDAKGSAFLHNGEEIFGMKT